MTWKCEVCGYVHQGGEPPAQCPVCGAEAELFSPFAVAAAPGVLAAATKWRCTICEHVHEGSAAPAQCPVCSAAGALFEPLAAQHGSPSSTSARARERLVVIGAGVAGTSAAEHARSVAPHAQIVLINNEEGLPYYRLNLTRLLAGEISEDSLPLHPARWFSEQRIELVDGEAARIQRAAHQVELRDGRVLAYDQLVLANGAHPFMPPLAGVTKRGVCAVRTLRDARHVLAHVRPGVRCVCVGGGLLGLETAGALARRGAQVGVLEGLPSLLPRQLARPAGELLRAELEALGIAVRCGVQVEELLGEEAVSGVRLKGGEDLAADLVVLATGVRPNSYLARLAGLETNRGIIVDAQMRTSDPHIFAAGDVAEHRGVLYGLWPSAYAQGVIAGSNALGAGLEFASLPPQSRLKVLAVEVFSIGEVQALDASYQLLERQQGRSYARLVCRDGRVVGANLYGDTALAALLKVAVEQGRQLVELTELHHDFPELAERGLLARQAG